MKKSYNKAFTLVELLAVIVILAIILVIAVPKIMDVINSSKKSTLETSVKMIASTAEKTKMQNTVLGKEDAPITCDSVAKLSSNDYESCTITFTNSTAKVTVKGTGKFEGLYVCNGTKNDAKAIMGECPPSSFDTDSWTTIISAVKSGNYPYKVGDTKEIALTGFMNGEEGSNGLYTLRIANTTPCNEVEVESKTACGFVLEFADIITTQKISASSFTSSWPSSSMRSYVNGNIYNALPNEIKDAIISTYVTSGTGPGQKNYYTTSEDKLYLLSAPEVYESEELNDHMFDGSGGTSRQLDYYKEKGVSQMGDAGPYYGEKNEQYAIKYYNGIATSMVLRSRFWGYGEKYFIIYIDGIWSYANSNYPDNYYGLAPAFRLSD